MDITSTISRIERELHATFDEVERWFEIESDVLDYKPLTGGWSVAQILEHIVLTSHFLLILIDKGAAKALKNTNGLDLKEELENYQFDLEGIEDIGVTKSFSWIRPEHMEPTGSRALSDIRGELNTQRQRIVEHLRRLSNGEGILYKTTMSVNNLGKIDVYQYIYFLIKHAQRHVQQMENNRTEHQES